MKRILSLLLVFVLILGTFASCNLGPKVEEADIQEAVKELNDHYKKLNGTAISNGHELVAQVRIGTKESGLTVFNVTWEASIDKVTFELKDGVYVAKLSNDIEESTEYTLTAHITSEGGQSADVSFNVILAVESSFGMISNPVAGTAYKFALLHGNEGPAVVYFDGDIYNGYTWYLNYTKDPSLAVDVYLETVEGVEGGYRLYFNKDGEKTYIVAFPRDGDTTKGTLKLDTAVPETYYTFSTEYNTLIYTSVTGEQFYIGSSGTYKSISCSAISYITGETSYPVRLYGAGGVEETLPEQNIPSLPAGYTSQDVVDLLYSLKSGQTTDKSYAFTGVVTEITEAYTDQYKNVTITVVVEGREDKPVLVYRAKDNGTEIGLKNLKVGDTVTVRGPLTNYNGKYETADGTLIEDIVSATGTPDDGGEGGGNEGGETEKVLVVVDSPVVGTAYKFGNLHGGDGNVNVYFNGNITADNTPWYLAYTKDAAEAVDVYLENVEGVEGGYRLYFNKDGVKTYIVAYPRDNDTTKGTLKLDTEVPETYYTFNTEHNTLIYTSVTGEQFYIGSNGTYKSISCSAISYISNSTSYICHLYAEGVAEEGGDNGDNGGSDEPVVTPTYTAPVEGEAYIFSLDQKTLGKTLYFNGTINGEGRMLTTDNVGEAVAIYFEAVTGGYNIYYMDGDVKTYINDAPYLNDKGNLRCRLAASTDPSSAAVWTYATDLGIVEIAVTYEGKSDTFFAGTYSDYNTISLSGAYYRDQIASGTQYPARITPVDGEVIPPSQGGDNGGNEEGGETPVVHTCEDLDGNFVCDSADCKKVVAPADGTTLTIAQALTLAKLVSPDSDVMGPYTTNKYYITGVVQSVASTTYGNLTIMDANGDSLYVYGLYSADGSTRYDAMTTKPIENDEITIYTVIGCHYGTPQAKNAWMDEVVVHGADHNYVDGKCTKCYAKEPVTDATTVSVTIAAYKAANGWTNATQYTTLKMDDNITVTASGSKDTGKYYDSGSEWRTYESDDGTVTFTAAEGKTIVSVKITYNQKNSGTLLCNGAEAKNGVAFEVNANTITFTVSNNDDSNAQVKITSIEVTYK